MFFLNSSVILEVFYNNGNQDYKITVKMNFIYFEAFIL